MIVEVIERSIFFKYINKLNRKSDHYLSPKQNLITFRKLIHSQLDIHEVQFFGSASVRERAVV